MRNDSHRKTPKILRSPGVRDGLIMTAATLLAGGLDYAFQLLTGRWLLPVEFSVFVALTAVLRVAVELTNVIRNVTAYYVASLSAQEGGSSGAINVFILRMWRWGGRWGSLALLAAALLSPLITWWIRADSLWPALAAALALLLLFIRPVTDGALQGLQSFLGLGSVTVMQAVLRVVIGVILIGVLDWQAAGAILSLPLASAGALVLAYGLLRPYFQPPPEAQTAVSISRGYSAQTLLGLLFYALIVNMDAMLVPRLFDSVLAGNYAPVVTLGKINLFIPLAMGLVLFPKATQRYHAGRDPRPILLLALGATLLPGLALTAVLFCFRDILVPLLFTDAYASLGLVLPLVGLATTFYAGINIWLNYALSLNRPRYIAALGLLLIVLVVGIIGLRNDLLNVAAIMAAVGLLGNVAGILTTWRIEAAR